MKRPATFSDAQRQRLTALTLTAAQIAELEATVLAFGRAWLASGPVIAEVRKPLETLDRHLTEAGKVLTAMLQAAEAGDGRPAMANAGNHLLAAASDRGTWPERVESIAGDMRALRDWCAAAVAGMPKQQRSNAGHWLPVARIWEALVRSHGNKRNMLRLSSSPGSAFREICGICYEVMTGKVGADPERAVKAYVAASRSRDHAQRTEVGIAVSRRTGRQRKKKTRLAS